MVLTTSLPTGQLRTKTGEKERNYPGGDWRKSGRRKATLLWRFSSSYDNLMDFAKVQSLGCGVRQGSVRHWKESTICLLAGSQNNWLMSLWLTVTAYSPSQPESTSSLALLAMDSCGIVRIQTSEFCSTGQSLLCCTTQETYFWTWELKCILCFYSTTLYDAASVFHSLNNSVSLFQLNSLDFAAW